MIEQCIFFEVIKNGIYYSIYRGCASSREKLLKVPGASELENYVYTKEC